MARLRPAPEFVLSASVKSLDTDDPRGGFEAVLSSPRLDRDGDVIAPGAFDPLPESIPIHLDHEMSTRSLVARAVPFYEGDVLKARGHFGSDDELSQAVRAKVASGLIDSMSVGFHRPVFGERSASGARTIIGGELLEASFVSVPANADARVVSAKATTSTSDPDSTSDSTSTSSKDVSAMTDSTTTTTTTSSDGDQGGELPASVSFLGSAPSADEVPAVKGPARLLGADAFSAGDVEMLRKSLAEGSPVSVKAGSSATVDMGVIPDYSLPPLTFAREQTVIADLIPQVSTDASTVTTYEVNAAATAAAAVAEAGAKPESDPEWAAVAHPVEKLAHFATVSTEVLADVAGFQQVISEELLAGLQLAESAQLLSGDGVSPNLEGILTNSGIQAQAGAGTDIEELLAAITKLRTVGFTEPDYVVMHPSDWNSAELALAQSTTNEYLAGRPFETGPASIWGVPIVLTTSIATGTALVGNFADGARIYVREAPRIMADPFHPGDQQPGAADRRAAARVGGAAAQGVL